MLRNSALLLCSLVTTLVCIVVLTPAAHAGYGTVTVSYSSETMETINDWDVCHFEDTITMTYSLTGNTVPLAYAEYRPNSYQYWVRLNSNSANFTTDFAILHDALLKLVYVDETTVLVPCAFITYYDDGDEPSNPYGEQKQTCWWVHEQTDETHYVDYYPPNPCPCKNLGSSYYCPTP